MNDTPEKHTTRQVTTAKQPSPMAILRGEMERQRQEFAFALPKQIDVDRFMRVVLTAVQQNPELLDCSRRTFFNACMQAANDGCLPDGREGAIIVRRDKNGAKHANW